MQEKKDKGQQPCRFCSSNKDLMNRKKYGNICRLCYNEKHAKFQKTKSCEYYLKHKENRDEYNRKKREENPKLQNFFSNRSYHKTRLEVIAHYSPDISCVKCGFKNHIAALSIDHIDGSGNEMRRNVKGHSQIYRWLKKNEYPEGYQVLCMNCQFIKKHENNECTTYLRKIGLTNEIL
jgi:hypothetical protein